MNNELYHYGVKGMKWGVRRFGLVSGPENKKIGRQTYKETYKVQRSAGNSRKESRKTVNIGKNAINNYKAKRNPQREDISQLSDAELRQRINRLQMEKQYAQLTARETSNGKKFVKDVLTNAAKQTATQYTARYMAKGVDKAIERALAGR